MSSSAVESGPPETARTRAAALASGSNSVFASAAETGAASSAADTLLFSLDTLLHTGRCTGKLAQDLAERRAGGLLLAERGKRLSKPQQRVRRLGGRLIFGRDVEESFGRVTVALTLEQAFTQPIGGVAGHAVAGISAQEAAKALLGQRIVLAQHVAVGEIVLVTRGLRGRQRGDHRAAGVGIATRGPGRTTRRPHGREIERSARPTSPGGADRLVGIAHGRRHRRRSARATDRAQRVRRAGRIRILHRIKRIATPAGRAGSCRRRWLRRRVLRARLQRRAWRPLRVRFLETVVDVFLQAAELAFELLIAELQLLDHARELPDLGFEAVETQHDV